MTVNCAAELSALKDFEQALLERFKAAGPFHCQGFSWPLQSQSTFLIDDLYGNKDELNFRERLVCKASQLSNRVRASIHLFEALHEPQANDRIYLTEQYTQLYAWLRKKYPHMIGSEYLTDMNVLQRFKCHIKMFPKRLNHQDLTAITFGSESMDHVLCFDCLEHIPNYCKALKEIHRVLKTGGQLLISVPFDVNNTDNLIRAEVKADGTITHHVVADYHGDPISKRGVLSFYTFGWELLDQLRAVGFKDAYGAVYWSQDMAYLGGVQVMICAQK